MVHLNGHASAWNGLNPPARPETGVLEQDRTKPHDSHGSRARMADRQEQRETESPLVKFARVWGE